VSSYSDTAAAAAPAYASSSSPSPVPKIANTSTFPEGRREGALAADRSACKPLRAGAAPKGAAPKGAATGAAAAACSMSSTRFSEACRREGARWGSVKGMKKRWGRVDDEAGAVKERERQGVEKAPRRAGKREVKEGREGANPVGQMCTATEEAREEGAAVVETHLGSAEALALLALLLLPLQVPQQRLVGRFLRVQQVPPDQTHHDQGAKPRGGGLRGDGFGVRGGLGGTVMVVVAAVVIVLPVVGVLLRE